MLRLEEEDLYAGIATSGSGGGSLPFMFMKMLTAGTMTSDTSFDVEWEKELPDLSTETYTASLTFEETEEDSGEWRLTCGVTKEGRYLGETDVYAIITAYDGSTSAPIKLTTLTKDGENPYTYGFSAGGYECYFYVEIKNDTITFTGGNAYIGEDDYGSVGIYWQIEPTTPAPVQKGSFDSTTQQLTLNYDYLVEKINSSTVVTDAQKTAAIAELDNSDVVVSMTTSIMPENEYMYGFQASAQVGLFVDVATPVTLKMVVVPSDTSAVISTIGTYKAIADFNTFMGDTMTEEQAEEQYAPLIVDENLCTVSGTIGNFSVEFN